MYLQVGVSLHVVKMHELCYLSPQVQNVMITLQKENPLKLSILLSNRGHNRYPRFYPWSLEVYHTFITTVETSTSPQAIRKLFRVVQSQCPRVDS
jgi:hypothetical protein